MIVRIEPVPGRASSAFSSRIRACSLSSTPVGVAAALPSVIQCAVLLMTSSLRTVRPLPTGADGRPSPIAAERQHHRGAVDGSQRPAVRVDHGERLVTGGRQGDQRVEPHIRRDTLQAVGVLAGARLHDAARGQHLVARHVLGEVAHVVVGRVGDDRLGRVDLYELAILHDGDALAHLDRLEEVVGDEDHGLVDDLLDAQQLVLHITADQRVEGAEGLVEKKNLGVHRERPGEANALLHAARELVREVALPAREADHLEHLAGLREARCLGDALDLEAVGDVVDDAAVGEQAEMLEHHAHVVAAQLDELLVVHGDHVLAVDDDRPSGRLDEARDAPYQGRLAAARQPHHHEGLALAHVERDVADGQHMAAVVEHLGARGVGAERLLHLGRPGPENLPDAAAGNLGFGSC